MDRALLRSEKNANRNLIWNVFCGCSSLTIVTIPSSVTSIRSDAFYGHSSSLVIYGEAGSYAETYANENSISFVADHP